VPWAFALRQLAPMSAIVSALAAGIALIDVGALVWLLPVGLPLLLSVPMTVLTSRIGVGKAMRAHNYLLIPEETKSPAVLKRAWLHASMRTGPALLAA
jgi:membrane glycosyltransferase